jgi:hypothetical protein
MYHVTTLSPALMCWPRSSTSRVAVRRKCSTGVAHRRISSVAFEISDGSSFSSCICSGSCINASIPDVIVWRVVSLPAIIRSEK